MQACSRVRSPCTFSCITCDHFISTQCWMGFTFPRYARRFAEPTVSKTTKRSLIAGRYTHGHVVTYHTPSHQPHQPPT